VAGIVADTAPPRLLSGKNPDMQEQPTVCPDAFMEAQIGVLGGMTMLIDQMRLELVELRRESRAHSELLFKTIERLECPTARTSARSRRA
jgi:hypothetical protein